MGLLLFDVLVVVCELLLHYTRCGYCEGNCSTHNLYEHHGELNPRQYALNHKLHTASLSILAIMLGQLVACAALYWHHFFCELSCMADAAIIVFALVLKSMDHPEGNL